MTEHIAPLIQVDSLGFRIPCRSFYIRANVTRDRPLPVVDEFVLRLLRICGQLPMDRLCAFFGLTRAECERVVRDLADRDLLVAEEDLLRLSNAAVALFRASVDDEPRLVEIEPWVENVWIDLISRSIVSTPRRRLPRNLVEVLTEADLKTLSTDFGREVFEENFRDYVARVRKMTNPDRVSIHSVAGVDADRFGSMMVSARKVISRDDARPKLEIAGASEAPRHVRAMTQSLTIRYGQLTQPRAQATSLQDFERLSGIQLQSYIDTNQEFAFSRWLAERPRFADDRREWIVGASYLEHNIKSVIARIASKSLTQPKSEVRWLRPAGQVWGMSPDLGVSLQALRRAVGLPDTPRHLGASLLMPQAVSKDSHKKLRSLFEKAEEEPGKLGTSLEIVSAGGVAAMLLVHLAVHGRETVPIGIVTDHPQLVARLDAQLRGTFHRVWVTQARATQVSDERQDEVQE